MNPKEAKMAIKSVGFRLHTDGKTEVKNDFAEIREAGQSSFDAVAKAANDTADVVATAAERAAERQIRSLNRQAAAAKVAAAGFATNAAFDATLGTAGSQRPAVVNLDRSTGAARASAAAFEAQFHAEEQAAAAALKLRAAIDPLWAAEQRLEQGLREVATAEKAGILSTDLLAAAQARVRKEFDDTTSAIRRQSGAGGGLSKNQRQTLIYTASDIVGSSANGINPMQLVMQQGPQVLQAFAAEEGGLAKIRALINPVTVGIAGVTAAVSVGAMAWLDYSNTLDKFNALAQGSGRVIGQTGEQLEANAVAAAEASGMTVSAAREIETAYVQTGKIGGDVLTGLTAFTRDFAAATAQDMPAAAAMLAGLFADPARGAEELTARYGVLSQAQLAHIQDLAEENRFTEAQAELLRALQPAFDGAADHANGLAKAWHGIASAASNAWNWMGKAIDRALGGGDLQQQIGDLYRQRNNLLNNSLGLGDTSFIDKQIADLRGKLTQVRNEQARAGAVGAMKIVDGVTGDSAAGDLRGKLGAVNKLLADGGRAAGLNAEQLARAREAQDSLTHAVDTFLSPEQKRVQLAAADVAISRARTPAAKAAAVEAKARLELSGQVITKAGAEADAQSKAAAALAGASRAGAGRAATLAREAASMEVSARAALDVADAYLKSSAAGATAEARRKALTDATKRGTDIDAQVARQQALQVAEGAAAGAKSVAQLREETAARAVANDNVSAGKLAASQMNQALSDEAALRPLLALQAISQGDALTRLTTVIGAYRVALTAANAEGERSAALQATRATDESILGMRDQAEFAGDRTGRGAIEIARRAAEREAADKFGRLAEDDPARTGYIDNKVNEARTRRSADQANYLAGLRNSQQDAAEIAGRELTLVGMSADKRQVIIDRLKAEIDLRSHGVSLSSEEAAEILRGVDAQADMNAKLRAATATMDDLRAFAADTLDPTDWKSWGDAGKSILGELKNEFIKLALLNPLKNLINGDNALPTISSALGLLGGSRAGFPTGLSDTITKAAPIGRNAAGTEWWSGGMTWVGENGPELIAAPRGSQITSAGRARQIVSSNDNRAAAPAPMYFDLRGAVMTADLLDQMNGMAQVAATQGAAGGAQIAKREARRAGKYRIRR
jgi:hypothetical protein